MTFSRTLVLATTLVAAGAGAAFAGMSPGYVEMRQEASTPQTIGEQLAAGTLTVPQVSQLIQFTGLTPEEAKQYTVPEVAGMRWTNN